MLSAIAARLLARAEEFIPQETANTARAFAKLGWWQEELLVRWRGRRW